MSKKMTRDNVEWCAFSPQFDTFYSVIHRLIKVPKMKPVGHMNLESYFMENKLEYPCVLHCTTANHYLWPPVCSSTFALRRNSGLNFFALSFHLADVHKDNVQFQSSSVHLYLVPENILH